MGDTTFPISTVDSHSEPAIDRIRLLQRDIARLQAKQLREIATYHAHRDGARDAAAELALALSVTENSAQKTIALATALSDRLPHTFAAMERGDIDSYKASKIAEPTAALSDEQARQVDTLMATRLAGKNPAQLRRSTIATVHRVDPDGAADRARRRRADRRVELLHGDDAMATLAADLPAEIATAAYTRIDRTARALRRAGEPRTLDQLRADVLTDLLLGTGTTTAGSTSPAGGGCWCGENPSSSAAPNSTDNTRGEATATPAPVTNAPGTTAPCTAATNNRTSRTGAKAEIYVYVDLKTLTGLRDNPAELAGHGTIPAWLARHIAADPSSTWRRIITDPATGTPIDVGRHRYRPPAVTAEYVRVRDRRCRFPSCHRPTHATDLDHATDWAHHGPTNTANLIGLCRRHHRLKTTPGWTYHHNPTSSRLTITTPSGHTHTTTPPPLPDAPPPR